MVFAGFNEAPSMDALARQYWAQWGEMMRSAGVQPSPLGSARMPEWNNAFDWWTRAVRPAAPAGFQDIFGRFQHPGADWFGQMQQLVGQFAGQDSTARDIAQAWRAMLSANGNDGFASVLQSMRGPGLEAMDDWSKLVMPMLEQADGELRRWLSMPTFGLAREHQERWQTLAKLQLDAREAQAAFQLELGKIGEAAFAMFETLLAQHEEPGRQLQSARALFDLWIDAAEAAFAEAALSEEFRHVYGQLSNTQLRLRQAVNGEFERVCAALGMPTRTEVDAAHRKIAELERALRRAGLHGNTRTASATGEAAAPETSTRPATRKPPARTAAKKVTKKTASRQSAAAARKSGKTVAAPKKPATRKPAAKKVAKKATRSATKRTSR